MMFLGIIIGIILGYFFKPQLDKVVIKAIQYVKKKAEEERNKESRQ